MTASSRSFSLESASYFVASTESFSQLNDSGYYSSGTESSSFQSRLTLNDEEWTELKRKYSSLVIRLDRIRAKLISVDTTLRPLGGKSIRELLGSLIESNCEIWRPRIEALMLGSQPDISSFAPIESSRDWQTIPVEDILAQLMRVRWANAIRLNAIPEFAFSHTLEDEEFGTVSIAGIITILVEQDAATIGSILGRIERGELVDR